MHSSVATAARVIDVGIVDVPGDERGRLTGEALAATLDALGPDEAASVVAVVASAGATNAGTVDDLAGVADACERHGVWFHVDGAYGGAGLAAPSVRERYRGIERADSFIVDPHKWLFAPYDCCALVYRDPTAAYGVFRQEAGYLDTVNQPDAAWSEWNPADYAYHLSRRARGLPLWFSLATYGTDAYRDAIERVLTLTRETAEEIARTAGARARDGPGAVGRALPPARLGRRRLRGLVAPAARGADRLRAADDLARREARAPVLREPPHDDRPRARGARHDESSSRSVPAGGTTSSCIAISRATRSSVGGWRREQAREATALQRRERVHDEHVRLAGLQRLRRRHPPAGLVELLQRARQRRRIAGQERAGLVGLELA